MSLPMLRLTALLAIACTGAAFAPSPLAAQQARTPTHEETALTPVLIAAPSSSGASTLRGPRSVPVGIDMRATTDSSAPVLPPQGGRHMGAGSNVALMGAGAAAVIVGLMIGGNGGTLVAISGGVIGLVGLFRFIR